MNTAPNLPPNGSEGLACGEGLEIRAFSGQGAEIRHGEVGGVVMRRMQRSVSLINRLKFTVTHGWAICKEVVSDAFVVPIG